LIKEDKQILKSRIKKELNILSYLNLFKDIDSLPKIPLIYEEIDDKPLQPKSMKDTHFTKYFDFLKKELE